MRRRGANSTPSSAEQLTAPLSDARGGANSGGRALTCYNYCGLLRPSRTAGLGATGSDSFRTATDATVL